MGVVASSAVEAGGQVHGVLPRAFLGPGEQGTGAGRDEETGHTGNLKGGKTTVVSGMHEVGDSLIARLLFPTQAELIHPPVRCTIREKQ